MFFEGVFENDDGDIEEMNKNIDWLKPDEKELETLKQNFETAEQEFENKGAQFVLIKESIEKLREIQPNFDI